MPSTALTPPRYAQAGDTLAWNVALPDYPATLWTLGYTIINAAAKITVTATASGDEFAVSVPAATTATWAAGDYTWVATVSSGVDRYTVGRGEMTVTPDLAAQTSGFDARSTARKALDDLRAALASWLATKGAVQAYTIDGVQMSFATAADIQQRIALLEREVAREDAAARLAAGLDAGRRVLVRF